ncbi:tetratricopeptide repeat protein 5 isoform X3 [Rhipicephalus microplus]|uniref:tetratricopeptide repeat protein 5 isoform X3 n=1 Tax=Rhipicephalus microplus TaxID=6941 RepID=UPI003F6C6A0D
MNRVFCPRGFAPHLFTFEAVDELYAFRDSYYVENPCASEKQKSDDVDERLKKILDTLDAQGGVLEKLDRAKFHMLKGKALNILEDYNQEAHEALSKAVKLSPKLVEAWNELGECYWKKGQITKARNCFEGVLKVTKDKVSLRNMSMVLRQVGETEEERFNNVCESVAKAKEALELDITDGRNWSILGNAYITLFFSGTQNKKSLQQALAAYSKALEDPRMHCSSELYHNHAVALQYDEDYQGALEQLEHACSLEPHWAQPREKAQNLMAYLQRLTDAVSHKGHLKPRKMKALLRDFKVQPLASLEQAKLKDLRPGKNTGLLLSVRVACSVLSQERFPFTICVLDEDASCVAVNVYNMADGRGFVIGDAVVIREPTLRHIQVNHKNHLPGRKDFGVTWVYYLHFVSKMTSCDLFGDLTWLMCRESNDDETSHPRHKRTNLGRRCMHCSTNAGKLYKATSSHCNGLLFSKLVVKLRINVVKHSYRNCCKSRTMTACTSR